jgi:hypothetical protein
MKHFIMFMFVALTAIGCDTDEKKECTKAETAKEVAADLPSDATATSVPADVTKTSK